MSLHLNEVSYFTEQFVNKIIEFAPGHFLAAVWDSNKYIVIDHEQERIETTIVHPHKENYQCRCWGLVKYPGFDIDTLPFLVVRDNTGVVLIDVKQYKAY